MITWDAIVTGFIVGIFAGIAQTIGSWFILKTVLNRIDKKSEEISQTVERLHLTRAQKNEFAQRLGSSSLNYVHEYGKTLKDAILWWKK
jgi:hypothetical protein